MKHLTIFAASAMAAAVAFTGAAARADDTAPKDRKIGYALNSTRWAFFQTDDGKAECPDGYNEGPREQFKVLYPNLGTVEGTQLERESTARYPMDKEDGFSYRQVKGKVSEGMNLDGKVGPNDFVTASGEKGIDNQLYRALGCTRLFRWPDGTYAHFTEMWVREMNYNRVLVELTNVDSMVNDDSVDVAIYRGKDRLMTDATGANIVPGGSNRVDERFAKQFTYHLKGKIVNGVLTTQPADVTWPWAVFLQRPGAYDFRGLRFQMKVDPEKAEGMVGGYADVETWYLQLVRSWSTHHSSYGGLSQPSFYRQLHQLADGYPDKTGAMTAISSALNIKMTQVYILHGNDKVAAAPADSAASE